MMTRALPALLLVEVVGTGLILLVAGCIPQCRESYEVTEDWVLDELSVSVTSDGFSEEWERSTLAMHPYVTLSYHPTEASFGMALENPDCDVAQFGITIFSDGDGDIKEIRMRYDYRRCSIDPTLQHYHPVENMHVDCPMEITELMMGDTLTGLRYEFDHCTIDILDDPPAEGPSVSGVEINGVYEVSMERTACR